jgi:protein transport protein SEC13
MRLQLRVPCPHAACRPPTRAPCAQVWKCADGVWSEQERLPGHTDWVRDVAWAPGLGLSRSTVASGGQDGQVYVWSEKPAGGWDRKLVHDFRPAPVWRVSWSLTGSILAVTDGTSAVTLWKETLDGVWQQVSH